MISYYSKGGYAHEEYGKGYDSYNKGWDVESLVLSENLNKFTHSYGSYNSYGGGSYGGWVFLIIFQFKFIFISLSSIVKTQSSSLSGHFPWVKLLPSSSINFWNHSHYQLSN